MWSTVLRYAIVGVINTAAHFLTTIALVESGLLEPVSASVVGFIVALLLAFALNRQWTFSQTDKLLERLYRFSLVSLLGLCLNILIMYAVVDWLAGHYLLGLLLVALVVPPCNFFLNYAWSFKPVADP